MVNKFKMFDHHQGSTVSTLISDYCRWPLSLWLVIKLHNGCAKWATLQQHNLWL